MERVNDFYKKRIADKLLDEALDTTGAVLIEGAKWCGKTTTGLRHAKSVIRIDDPAEIERNIIMSKLNPTLLLGGETPRLVDEWQLAPKLWDAARYAIDSRRKNGQFIFTGSSTPVESKEITHSGAGRFSFVLMRTMSLFESGDSNGSISLGDLFDGKKINEAKNNLDLERLAFLLCRGGWPDACLNSNKYPLKKAHAYVDALLRGDFQRVDETLRDIEKAKRLLRSLSRNQGGQVSLNTLCQDVNNGSTFLSDVTAASYIRALKKIYVEEDLPAWSPNLRSKTAIREQEKRYFTDPSIAVACLGIGPDDLLRDLKTFGFLFEAMCIRDLRVYASSLDGEVFHYRDKSNLECDAVIHLRSGKYGLIEIKLGDDLGVEKGAASLKKLNAKLDEEKMGSPSFMMILTGVGAFSYRRNDGIYVVPLGCLKN